MRKADTVPAMTTTTAKQRVLLDTFTTAMEGGIGYWSRCTSYHWMTGDLVEDYESFRATIRVNEDEVDVRDDVEREGKAVVIDAATIERGFRNLADLTKYPAGSAAGRTARLALALVRSGFSEQSVEDWDDWADADAADMVVQAALFGDVVYG
jgi:hypothetical protein